MLLQTYRPQYSVNVTLIDTGNTRVSITHFTVISALLLWSPTGPTTSLGSACTLKTGEKAADRQTVARPQE